MDADVFEVVRNGSDLYYNPNFVSALNKTDQKPISSYCVTYVIRIWLGYSQSLAYLLSTYTFMLQNIQSMKCSTFIMGNYITN